MAGKKIERVLLIDGDIFVWQHAASAETPIKWDEELWTLHAYEDEAKRKLDAELEELKKDMEADRLVIALSHSRNFRYDVLPTYKSNRAEKRPPMLRPKLKQHLIDNYETFVRPGLEGDDVLGILMTNNAIVPGEKIMVSIDKDMRTIPGKLLRLNDARKALNAGEVESVQESVIEITEKDADRYHLYQALIGDATDGYPGCPGIGGTSGADILDDEPHVIAPYEHEFKSGKRKGETETRWRKEYGAYTPWQTILSYYAKAGLGEDYALSQARVARICRSEDYDYDKKEVILWEPRETE